MGFGHLTTYSEKMLCVVKNSFREMFIHWLHIWKDLVLCTPRSTVKQTILKQHANQWDLWQNYVWAC